MPFEVELKARVREPDMVEARAAQLGRFQGTTLKEDIYFRPATDPSPIPAIRYRLRRTGAEAVVTFKQRIETGDIEINDEVEFAVDNMAAFFRFTHHIGFVPFVVKHKLSRLYQVGQAHLELNEVKHLGHFVEIEILCQAEAEIPLARAHISRLLADLGLSETDVEPRRYLELIQAAHPVSYRYLRESTSDWPFAEVG
jgi:adenylate cyclase class 2